MTPGCGDALVHLVVADLDGVVALLGQGHEGQGGGGLKAVAGRAAAAPRRSVVVLGCGKTASADRARGSKGGSGRTRSSVRGGEGVGAAIGAGHGGRGRAGGRPSGCGGVADGGCCASVAGAVVSLLEPAVRNDLDW